MIETRRLKNVVIFVQTILLYFFNFLQNLFLYYIGGLVQVEVILSGFVLNIDFWNFKKFFFTQLENLQQSSHRILIKYN